MDKATELYSLWQRKYHISSKQTKLASRDKQIFDQIQLIAKHLLDKRFP